MSDFFGFNGADEQSTIEDWHPQMGFRRKRRWRGLPVAIDQIALGCRNAGLAYSRREETPGGYWIIEVEYGAEESHPVDVPLADMWDRGGNDVQKPIWNAPLVKAELDKMYLASANVIDSTKLAYLARFKADVEALTRGEVVTFIPTTGEVSGVPLTLAGILETLSGLNLNINIEVIKKLFYDLTLGEDSYRQSEFVLRHRTIVLKGTSLKPDDSNVDCVFTTTAFLKQKEGVPNDLPFLIPERMWLKKSPTVDQIESNKWQFTTEYYGALSWSILGYPDAA